MLNRETCLSRRSFLHGIASFGISCAAAGTALGSPAAGKRTLAYVGTDTTPVDGPANGKGIYLYESNPASGELKLVKLAVETASPSWLSLHPSGNYLYAVNEVSNYEGNSRFGERVCRSEKYRRLASSEYCELAWSGPGSYEHRCGGQVRVRCQLLRRHYRGLSNRTGRITCRVMLCTSGPGGARAASRAERSSRKLCHQRA